VNVQAPRVQKIQTSEANKQAEKPSNSPLKKQCRRMEISDSPFLLILKFGGNKV